MTIKAKLWFKCLRHQLRHGQEAPVIATLAGTIQFRGFSSDVRKTFTKVHHYLLIHQSHINYQRYEELGLPVNTAPLLDVLFVPGGKGINQMVEDTSFLSFLQERGQRAKYVTSVCTVSLFIRVAD